MEMIDTFSYSPTGENYYGQFATREAAIEAARAEVGSGQSRFWTGRNRAPEINLYCLSAETVIEDIVNQEDFQIDAADNWPNATKEQQDELTGMLQRTFRDWMARHGLAPTYWLVEDVQEHSADRFTA